MVAVADPQNGNHRQDDGSSKNRDEFLRILRFHPTFAQNIDGISGNHETTDGGNQRIDLAHALVGDRSGDVYRGGGSDCGQHAGGRGGQAHVRRVPQFDLTKELAGLKSIVPMVPIGVASWSLELDLGEPFG